MGSIMAAHLVRRRTHIIGRRRKHLHMAVVVAVVAVAVVVVVVVGPQ